MLWTKARPEIGQKFIYISGFQQVRLKSKKKKTYFHANYTWAIWSSSNMWMCAISPTRKKTNKFQFQPRKSEGQQSNTEKYWISHSLPKSFSTWSAYVVDFPTIPAQFVIGHPLERRVGNKHKIYKTQPKKIEIILLSPLTKCSSVFLSDWRLLSFELGRLLTWELKNVHIYFFLHISHNPTILEGHYSVFFFLAKCEIEHFHTHSMSPTLVSAPGWGASSVGRESKKSPQIPNVWRRFCTEKFHIYVAEGKK